MVLGTCVGNYYEDANGNVKINSKSGSITVGALLTNGQTLKLGPNGATEMVFAPNETGVSEKISLTNTSGDADDAISIVSSVGGIKLSANGNIILANLPNSDSDLPVGALYNSSGTLKIFEGGGGA
tara:strand:- start:526 stop:903 length:378 start_codon:yes stop_codon:yes gene_type:complete